MLISNPLGYWSTGERSDQDAVVEYGKDQPEASLCIMITGCRRSWLPLSRPIAHNLTVSCKSFRSSSLKFTLSLLLSNHQLDDLA
jgi:hypothetical protein